MIELQMWVFILLVVFGVLGVILAIAIIFSGVSFLIDNIKCKIQDYKDNYQKYEIYYWKHHKSVGIFEYETDDTKEQQEQEVKENE